MCQARRLLYYWHILYLSENELVYKFYSAQLLKPGRNDWVIQIAKDKKELNFKFDDEEIRSMSRDKFKGIILKKINELAAKYFQEIKSRQQKIKQLKINDKFTPAAYLFSSKLSKDEIRTLFKLRSATIDVKGNMSSSFKDRMWCRTCYLFSESQEHLLQCGEIRNNLKNVDFSSVKYEMIYGSLKNQENIAKVYHLILQARKDILNNRSAIFTFTAGGPLHQLQFNWGATNSTFTYLFGFV